MSLYDKLNGGQQAGPANMQQQLQQLQSDPLSMAQRAGYQIPQNLANNPQAMVQHLIQTGQVGGSMLQRIMPMMQKLMGK
jgi:hypothetical protein